MCEIEQKCTGFEEYYKPPDITKRNDCLCDLVLINCSCGCPVNLVRDDSRMEYTIKCENCGRKVCASFEYMHDTMTTLSDLVRWWNLEVRKG